MLPVLEFAIESRELQGAGGDFIELLGMGAVGAFDGAVEFWGSRRENEQTKSASLAGLFKEGLEFTAAIDLDGADGKRGTGHQGIQEERGGSGGGAAVDLADVPAGDHIACRELLQHQPGHEVQFEGVHLHQIAGLGRLILLGFANGVGSWRAPAAGSGEAPRQWLHQKSSALQMGQDASDHGDRYPAAFAAEQDYELVLAPAGKLTA